MNIFKKKKINKKINEIKKVDTYYEKTINWYKCDLNEEKKRVLNDYLKTFAFDEDEKNILQNYLKECIQEETFSFSILCEKDKFLKVIKELLLKNSSFNLQLYNKFKSIITPFLNNEITSFIRNDDDLIRMMSIFFFYPIYSIFPLVSSLTETKIISGFLKSEEEIFIYQINKIIKTFIEIPTENYQFSIMSYLLIDKYMDEEVFEKNVRKKFLYFCHHTFVNKSCTIPSSELENSDYIAFKHYFDKLISIYNVQSYDYLYDFMIYLFESLNRTSCKEKINHTESMGEDELEGIYKETFSKSYLTIYFFILMSNLTLRKQNSSLIEENSKKAFIIQCYDDICDIYQDKKNKINTIYTYYILKKEKKEKNKKRVEEENILKLEKELKRIFLKNREFLYDNLHEKYPILCRTLIYITTHIETFLIYKNKDYVSKEFIDDFYENKYYNETLFSVLKIDLFNSTHFLVNMIKNFIQ
jgi:hypothetical protein